MRLLDQIGPVGGLGEKKIWLNFIRFKRIKLYFHRTPRINGSNKGGNNLIRKLSETDDTTTENVVCKSAKYAEDLVETNTDKIVAKSA